MVKKEGIAPTAAEIEAALEPEKTIAVTKDTEIKAVKPKVLAVVDDGKRSKLMLRELADRGIDFIENKANFKELEKELPKLVEKNKGQVNVVYLPVTNTDYNKNSQLYSNIRANSEISVNYYFDGHDDQEISNRCFRLKIE